MNVTRTHKKYAKKSPDHEKSSFKLSHAPSRNDRDRKCESLLLDRQPCQLSDLARIDTYHIGKSVDDHESNTEEILFDFEEEFHGNKHFYETPDTNVRSL